MQPLYGTAKTGGKGVGHRIFWFARNAEGRGKSVIDPSDCRMQCAG